MLERAGEHAQVVELVRSLERGGDRNASGHAARAPTLDADADAAPRPNAITYATLAASCARERDPRAAVRALASARRVAASTAATATGASSSSSDDPAASTSTSQVRAAYNAAIAACARALPAAEWRIALSLLDEMRGETAVDPTAGDADGATHRTSGAAVENDVDDVDDEDDDDEDDEGDDDEDDEDDEDDNMHGDTGDASRAAAPQCATSRVAGVAPAVKVGQTGATPPLPPAPAPDAITLRTVLRALCAAAPPRLVEVCPSYHLSCKSGDLSCDR